LQNAQGKRVAAEQMNRGKDQIEFCVLLNKNPYLTFFAC